MVHWLANLFSPRRARKSPKRKSRRRPKRSKSPKRKSPKRGSPKRKSRKRSSPKRKSPKRKSPKRKSPKRKSRKRSSPKRGSPKRGSPKRKSRKASGARGSLEHRIKSADWFIVTMKGCRFCGEAKKLLRANGQKYKSTVLTEKNEDKIWPVTDKLAKKKYRYFPMIFRRGRFFGGYGELQKKYEKKNV